MPKRFRGKLLLKAELRKADVDLALIPDRMLDDVVNNSFSLARAMLGVFGDSFMEEFTNAIRLDALRIAGYLRRDPSDFLAAAIANDDMSHPLAGVLVKYQIKQHLPLTGRPDRNQQGRNAPHSPATHDA